MVSSSQLADVHFRTMPHVPLDQGGPADHPTAMLPSPAETLSAFELFRIAADCAPASVAVSDGQTVITYADLLAAASRLAGSIAAAVPAGGLVALWLYDDANALTAILAANAAGRAFMSLNPSHPPERNAAILGRARPHALLVTAATETTVPAGVEGMRLRIETAATDASDLPAKPQPDAAAAIIYTSGSTGAPKGIVESQRTMVHRSCANVIAHHLNAADRCMTLAALGTVVGLHQCLGTLFAGGTVLMPASGTGASGILRLAAAEAATVLVALPGLLRELMAIDTAAASFAHLRLVRTTSEALPPADLAAWRGKLPARCHYNVVYGQTEITVSDWYIPPGAEAAGTALPVGYVRAGVDVAICNGDGAPDETGELVVRSQYLALGEWEDGACVPGRMLPDPDDAARRILFTGDLVRLRPDGLLYFLGRLDRQIKIRGHRIEPVEVETALLSDPRLVDAVVAVSRDGDTATLLAFVVPKAGSAPAPDAIRTRLRTVLPPAMVPSEILILDALPRLPGGKVDERLLLDRHRAGSGLGIAGLPPTAATPAARRLVQQAWSKVLGRAGAQKAQRLDGRFEQEGGDSLRLLRLVFELELATGLTLSLEHFRVDQTLADMAARLSQDMNPVGSDAGGCGDAIFVLPGLGGDEPRLAAFRAGCAALGHIVPITYPAWPVLYRQRIDMAALVGRIADRIDTQAAPGPLSLIGYSFGGIVAYAVAAELVARGRAVRMLVLLDTQAPWHKAANAPSDPAITPSRADAVSEAVSRRLLSPRWAPALHAASWLPLARLPGAFSFFLQRRLLVEMLIRVGRQWRLDGGPFPALRLPVALLRADGHARDEPRDLGWGERCSDVRVADVPGTHYTMFDGNNLAVLCRRFGECFDSEHVKEAVLF